MPNFTLPIQYIYRDVNHAELHARKEQIDHFGAVRQANAQPVSRNQTACAECMCEAVAGVFDLAKGAIFATPVASHKLERWLVAAANQGMIKEMKQAHRG